MRQFPISIERSTVMLVLKLAYRNLVGAGLRTWLNVFVLSLVFIVIVWTQGLIGGMSRYAINSMIESEIGGGQYWHSEYDPYDPFTLEDSHAVLSEQLAGLVKSGDATPILISSGAFYPEGRVQATLLKGIDPDQRIINIPSVFLDADTIDAVPALIGAQTAKQTKLKIGDYVTIRWRDVNGMFDADDARIVQIMNTSVPSVDRGQIWIPLERMRSMLGAPGEATIVVVSKGIEDIPSGDSTWSFKDTDYLLKSLIDMIKTKSVGSTIIYMILLCMGLLAIFDTQVLAIWRRRKEIGMLMALGMERTRVIALFTTEGALHAILAVIAGAIYGIPLLYLTLEKGLAVPEIAGDMGFAMPERLYPHYGAWLAAGTTALVLVTVTVVSFLPASKIAKLKPTDALRGKRK